MQPSCLPLFAACKSRAIHPARSLFWQTSSYKLRRVAVALMAHSLQASGSARDCIWNLHCLTFKHDNVDILGPHTAGVKTNIIHLVAMYAAK